jgi:hypothetical protein
MLAPAGLQALCPSADGRLVDMSRKKLAKDSRRGFDSMVDGMEATKQPGLQRASGHSLELD